MNFVFWGLFVALGLVLVGYLVWMVWEESRERPKSSEETLE